MERIMGHPLFTIFVIAMGFFDCLVIALVLTRRTTKHLIEDLGLARHILVTWFFVPLFRAYFWLLESLGKLQVNVNSPIPWEEPRLIFAANHRMPKMQDTFLLAIIIFFLRPRNYLNPIRYFPKSTADEANFVNSRFFKMIGNNSLIPVDRSNGKQTNRLTSTIGEAAKHFEESGGIEIFYVERGRTQTAMRKGRISKRITPEGEELILGRLGTGAAALALETNTPIIPIWGQITYDDSYPHASPVTVLRGLAELLLNPKIKAIIDINHPTGPLRPVVEKETPRELTRKLENVLFEVGQGQLKRLKSKR